MAGSPIIPTTHATLGRYLQHRLVGEVPAAKLPGGVASKSDAWLPPWKGAWEGLPHSIAVSGAKRYERFRQSFGVRCI